MGGGTAPPLTSLSEEMMMIKRGLTAGILLSLLLFMPLAGQRTDPVGQDYPLLRQAGEQSIDRGLSGMFESTSLWERTDSLDILAYTTNRGVGLDSVYYTQDSLNQHRGEVLYQITTGGRGYGQVTNIIAQTAIFYHGRSCY